MSDADVRCSRCQRFMPMETCDVCTIDDAIDKVLLTPQVGLIYPEGGQILAAVVRELKGRCNPQQVQARFIARATKKP